MGEKGNAEMGTNSKTYLKKMGIGHVARMYLAQHRDVQRTLVNSVTNRRIL